MFFKCNFILFFSCPAGSVCLSGWSRRRFVTVIVLKHLKNIIFRMVEKKQEWKMKMLDNYLYQVCNLIYYHIQCTGWVCAGGRYRTWITCCAWGLLCCFQKIQYVRPTASLLNNILFFFFIFLSILSITEQSARSFSDCLKQWPTKLALLIASKQLSHHLF